MEVKLVERKIGGTRNRSKSCSSRGEFANRWQTPFPSDAIARRHQYIAKIPDEPLRRLAIFCFRKNNYDTQRLINCSFFSVSQRYIIEHSK
jgi:hypothetical protein